MSFKFMSNKIDTRSVLPTLSEVVKQARTKEALASSAGQTKTASVAAPVAKKTASAPAKPAVKVAEEKEKEEGEESGQLAPKANPTNEPKKPEGAKGTSGKKSTTDGEGESSGQLDVEPLHQEGESTGKKPAGLDTQKESASDKTVKTARFVRVAELTGKQKEFLRKTWSLYWPKSFIDALLA